MSTLTLEKKSEYHSWNLKIDMPYTYCLAQDVVSKLPRSHKPRLIMFILSIQNEISFSLIRIIHIPCNNYLACTIRQKYGTYSNLYN